MKKTLLLLLFITFHSYAQVGIGTSDPQADLHIAGTTSTIRIESLNNTNQPVLNDGIKLAPAYVTADGDITIKPSGYVVGGPAGSVAPLNFLLTYKNFIPDGVEGARTVINNGLGTTLVSGLIYSLPFTSPQSALVEVKYGITIALSATDFNTANVPLTDPPTYGTNFTGWSCRTFRIYFCIDLNNDGLSAIELSKRYGIKGQAYTSGSQGSLGYAYMNSQGYANIPAGNHSLKFFGEVEDGVNKYTSVSFGSAQDYLKLRIYN